MRNADEQTQEILNRPINLIEECERNLEKQKVLYNQLKHDIIEWEGALIRANLPIKKITYKGKNSPEYMRKEWTWTKN